MKLLKTVPEAVMVAAFLKAEISSVRFSDDLKSTMEKLGIAEKIVVNPNLQDEHENQLRARLLGDYRGYKQHREIFQNFPDDLVWYRAELTRQEIGKLRYVDYSYWNELTDHTHLVKDAVKNIQKGKIIFNVSHDRFWAVTEQIKRGGHDFEPMILWGNDANSPLEILEGHLRATAFGLAGDKAPENISVIVGLQSKVGLARGTVKLVPYDLSWETRFAAEAKLLQQKLGIDATSIQHVGSTAIPGILAKPIIDIAVPVDSLDVADKWAQPLAELGYWDKGPQLDMPERRFFAKGPDGNRTVYLHLATRDEYQRLLAFRDALRANPSLAKEYSDLKVGLAASLGDNRAAYTHQKDDFIKRILRPTTNGL